MEDTFYAIAAGFVPFYLIQIISMWRIYLKAGKPGWASIIPIYNIIVLLEIIKKPVWWIVLLIIPVVNIVFWIWIVNLLSKSFGKNEGFTVGLLFLSFIFYPLLGFGSPKYIYNEEPNKYDDISENIRSKIVIWALALSFAFPLMYLFFVPNYGILGLESHITYGTINTVLSSILGGLVFFFAITVGNKYRNAAIILSMCLIFVERTAYFLYPYISNL
ncbi:MAG: hypothetical protein JXR31_09250 [Prolixibacteraceae bacterium]|nr:hypothetical protein [Prolixibacteraceae bacterium]MBN2774420.1 hypothetical protein [Prolixibacteraceae bacterium]